MDINESDHLCHVLAKWKKKHDEHGINETITSATSLYKWLYFYIDGKGMENKGEWTIII